MKNFIDTIYEKKALIVLFVAAVLLLSGYAKYHQKKVALEKEIEGLILDGLTPWFHPESLQHVDGKKGVYILEDQITEKVRGYVDQWNEEGCTAFLDLKKLTEYSTDEKISMEQEASLKEKIVDQINKEDFDEEKKEVMRFMVEGKTADTRYEGILEIEGELFLECVLDLNLCISGALELRDYEVDLRREWINTLDGRRSN